MREIRCPDCGKVLMRADARGPVQIPCDRCAREGRNKFKDILLISQARAAATTGQ